MERGLVGSFRRYPRRWRVSMWLCTDDGDVSPTAAPISRTDGGKPRSETAFSMNLRMSSCRSVMGASMEGTSRADRRDGVFGGAMIAVSWALGGVRDPRSRTGVLGT